MFWAVYAEIKCIKMIAQKMGMSKLRYAVKRYLH